VRPSLALPAATFLAAVVSAPAGATGTATVPVKTYVTRADVVCLDVAKKAAALRTEAEELAARSGSLAEARSIAARVYRRQLGLVRSMRLRLIAIGTPRGARAAGVAVRLVRDIRRGERALADVVAVAENGSYSAVAQAVSRYRTISLASARAVRDSGLGFRYCGAGA
jgi:hypothetical protein